MVESSARQRRRALKIEGQLFRVFDAFLHFDEESNSIFSIHGAMIIAEREVHHWANFDFSINGHRPCYDFMHAEDPALWRV